MHADKDNQGESGIRTHNHMFLRSELRRLTRLGHPWHRLEVRNMIEVGMTHFYLSTFTV